MSSPENFPPAMSPADQRLWSTLMHLSNIIVPLWAGLIGYLVLKDRGAFVRQHTAAALNFQLTMLIGFVVGFVLTLVFIGVFVLLAVSIVTLVFSIMAAMAANSGQAYKYPIAIEFVS